MRKILSCLIFTVLALTSNSCGFDLSSNDNTIELPNTYGINVEVIFTVPNFILNNEVTFEEVSITYKVPKNDAFAEMVKIYVSDDQTADALENGDDEDVINVTMGVNEKSGVIRSQLLIDIVNSKQPQFVIGAQNLSFSTNRRFSSTLI